MYVCVIECACILSPLFFVQVQKLQAILKPMMLRRLKEDVEKKLAPKEETIIEVELTNIQKKYYRAILEKNFSFLSKGAGQTNVPNLVNTMMELRKCCNHPYLIKGAENSGADTCSFQRMLIKKLGWLLRGEAVILWVFISACSLGLTSVPEPGAVRTTSVQGPTLQCPVTGAGVGFSLTRMEFLPQFNPPHSQRRQSPCLRFHIHILFSWFLSSPGTPVSFSQFLCCNVIFNVLSDSPLAFSPCNVWVSSLISGNILRILLYPRQVIS